MYKLFVCIFTLLPNNEPNDVWRKGKREEDYLSNII